MTRAVIDHIAVHVHAKNAGKYVHNSTHVTAACLHTHTLVKSKHMQK